MANKKKKCSTCLKKKISWWELRSDCATCRRHWRAFNRGETQISPMERAITAEQIKRVKKSHKKNKNKSVSV